MKIIVVGGGKVGSALCRSLVAEKHDVILIEQNEAVLNRITKRYDIMGIVGNGANFKILEQADVEHCDIFIAMTEHDEVNMVSAVLAKRMGAKETIVRVRNPEYSNSYFKEKNILPTAMIDISDGLASEIMHICKDSGIGCNIYEEKIPIDYQTFKMAEELNMNATVCALSGGEDYELLFTAPLEHYDLLTAMPGISVIGHTCKASEGCYMTTRDGNTFELKAQGWQNFSSTTAAGESENKKAKEDR